MEPIKTAGPYPLLDNTALLLGRIARQTPFETGLPAFRQGAGEAEAVDPIDDHTSLVFQLKDRGLIILSGCAHSGIVTTVRQAVKTTGADKIHPVMGGFHLSGAFFEPLIEPTIAALKELNPDYIRPTLCTGRTAIMATGAAMPEKFILNMSGAKSTFGS